MYLSLKMYIYGLFHSVDLPLQLKICHQTFRTLPFGILLILGMGNLRHILGPNFEKKSQFMMIPQLFKYSQKKAFSGFFPWDNIYSFFGLG